MKTRRETVVYVSILCIMQIYSCHAQHDDNDDHSDGKKPSSLEMKEVKQIQAEQKLKDVLGSIGSNQHYKIPSSFKDYGRRFVLQYPYAEKKTSFNVTDEASLDKIARQFLHLKEDQSLIPVKASPELMLSVAKQSARLAATNSYPDIGDKAMRKNILRSGDYWNDVIKEEVNPELIVRSGKEPETNSINLEFMPGSYLYALVSELKKISPRLLYVINDSE